MGQPHIYLIEARELELWPSVGDRCIKAVHLDRHLRSAGVPIWASSTLVDEGGFARAQEIMVQGGTLPIDKKVAYRQIVTTAYAEKAQQKFASK